MSFTDESSWEMAFAQDYYRESIGIAVEPIYFPVSFSSPALRVRVLSPGARKTWRAAGEIVQVLGVGENAGVDFEGETKFIPLNAAKLILFAEFQEYKLKFYPKFWIGNFQVQIDRYLDN